MPKYQILLTGSSGAIGRTVVPALIAAGHHVRGFDLVKSPNIEDMHIGNLTDMQAVDKAMESMDTLIHLGAEPNDCDFMTRLLPANIVGVYNVMDSARRHNLRRVILASSIQVYSGLWNEFPHPLKIEHGVAPLNHYGVTKVFAETMGRMYSYKFGLSVIVVRIGWFMRSFESVQKMMKNSEAQNFFFSHNDVCRFFVKAVEAGKINFCILAATSKWKKKQILDLDPAKRLIGYEPQDTFPEGLPFKTEKN